MALVKCPDCGTEISDQAPACVKCGRPRGIADQPRTVKARSGVADGVKIGFGMFVVLPVVVIGGLLIGLAVIAVLPVPSSDEFGRLASESGPVTLWKNEHRRLECILRPDPTCESAFTAKVAAGTRVLVLERDGSSRRVRVVQGPALGTVGIVARENFVRD